MFKLLCVVALLSCCSLVSSHGHASRCMPSLGKFPFDDQKFSGDWYSVANVFRPNIITEEIKCDKIHYRSENVGNVTRTHFDVFVKLADGSEKSIEGRGQALKPGFASCTSMAFKFPKEEKWHNVMKHTILATDYETYALVHGCKEKYDEKEDAFNTFVINQIWSRSKTLDEGVLKTLKSVMSSLDVPDDEWVLVDNSAC